MVEVIDMERWRQRRSRSSGQDTTPEQRATLRRQNEELERQQIEALATEMREKLGRAKLQPADREVLASNLWRSIQKARAAGVMKREITHRAGLGDGASSKRLDCYTLPEGLKPAVREKRLDKLAKKSRRYLQLVEATAELANWKNDKAVLELTSGSSALWTHCGPWRRQGRSVLPRLAVERLEPNAQGNPVPALGHPRGSVVRP